MLFLDHVLLPIIEDVVFLKLYNKRYVFMVLSPNGLKIIFVLLTKVISLYI